MLDTLIFELRLVECRNELCSLQVKELKGEKKIAIARDGKAYIK